MAIIGVLLALSSAFFASITDVLRKRNSASFDAVTATWALSGTTFVLALPVALAVNGIGLHAIQSLHVFARPFPTSAEFWVPFGITLFLNGSAAFLYMRALSKVDLSVAGPLSTLTPVFLFFTVPFVTGEFPSWIGTLGILMTTLGTFLLMSQKGRGVHLWTPFARLLREPVYRDVLIVALLYAVVSPFEKIVVLSGGSLWYTVLTHGGLALLLLPVMFHGGRWNALTRARDWPMLLPFGAVNLLRSYAQFTALGFISTFYVIGLKRAGVLLGVLWGRVFFKEKQTGRRAIAAAIMVLGAVLILIASVKS
jgi:drug/metabolite transporter (DMT)-like permease